MEYSSDDNFRRIGSDGQYNGGTGHCYGGGVVLMAGVVWAIVAWFRGIIVVAAMTEDCALVIQWI